MTEIEKVTENQLGPQVAVGQHIPALDGIRAIAIVLVLVTHSTYVAFQGGTEGVDVFFVLSGFLITSLLLDEWRTQGTISLTSFYIRRIRRLFPALALVTAFCAVAVVAANLAGDEQRRATGLGLPAALMYLSAWPLALGWTDLGVLSPTWSLAVEEHFYLVWPLALVVGVSRLRSALAPAVVILLASEAVRIADLATHAPIWRMYYGPDLRAEQLLLGCLLALSLSRIRDRTPPWLIYVATLAGAAGLILALPINLVHSPGYYAGGSFLIGLASCGLIVGAVLQRRSAVALVLGSSPFVWLGQRSYALYLWHPAVIAITANLVGQHVHRFAFTIAWLIPSVLLAAATRPFERRFLNRRQIREGR